ncbi:MAG: PH domain-containing protein [Lachnospiraceae bacterium]|nr:PH domain-containing protein [Lachnospiraceae bacterium]
MEDIMDFLWSDRKRTLFGLPLSFTKYSMTEERLFIEQGFLNKKEDEVRLYRIMDVSLSRSFGQRLFGVGTIHCCSADKSMKDFDILSIKHPKDVKEQLSELVEKQRDAKRVTNREFMSDHHDMDDDFDDDDH